MLRLILVRGLAAVLGVIAVILMYGGIVLAANGGSIYYALAGVALGISASLLFVKRREGVWLYGGIICVTMAWAIAEVGFDGWSLMPRLIAWLLFGLLVASPWVRGTLQPATMTSSIRKLFSWRGMAGCLLVAIALGSAIHMTSPRRFDPRYQAGMVSFPEVRAAAGGAESGRDWPQWGGNLAGERFSPLTQITPNNVGQLELAWTAPVAATEAGKTGGLEVTPLMVNGIVYSCSGTHEIFAVDAETGKPVWHSPVLGAPGRPCRGIAYYRVPNATGACAGRILTATGTALLVALDARTGKPCSDFGTNGKVNLLEGLSTAPEGYYRVTSAPQIVRGKVVLGGWVSDGQYWGEPSGAIRAFDAVTGKLAWAWDMGRPDRTGAPPPGESYTRATPNSWAPMSADEKLGLVYVPTGNATPDYFGAQRRSFDDKYSSSVVALDADSGRVRWSFQTTHHDVWDYDVASQPVLTDISTGGHVVPAVVQFTKRGEIFVLDRRTGTPLRPVIEKPAPQDGKVPQERLSPTQPFSDAMPSFRNPDVRESDMWGVTPLDQLWCRIRFRQARYEGPLTPPGTTPSISSPGYVGGMNWGTGAVDVDHGVMVFTSGRVANYVRLIERRKADAMGVKPIGDGSKASDYGGMAAQAGTPYAADIKLFMSPLAIPCQAPPLGFISAVDLVTGKLVWSRPFGTMFGLQFGTPAIGGPIVTRAGLAFIGASIDGRMQAIDIKTGKEVWHSQLPRGAFGTPITYTSPKSGRQFVVIAAGSSPQLAGNDDAVLMAFALKRR
ncbi:quinoprotein glucose dehydrogenase [Novosphingobium fluoreni]|uniref:Quinoprotein glucose dehydrogenase n=1 Tax=Novosphingobium fluoreni TaxID=1391222 RepID=A0A7W6FZQ4_9SPHN|nr:membrane-bound PQQ-dependent dehydrogenase, glucose/quinate/shikimate family [Novosphingobium fluoreni]MBB3941370.1 quinoprotein glucose dehydrogenase [Novosphingobium fluoreni]